MNKKLGISRRNALAALPTVAASIPAALETEFAPGGEQASGFQPGMWYQISINDAPGPWLDAGAWAQPLQDWRRNLRGEYECLRAAPNRQVHLLTLSVADQTKGFRLGMVVARADGKTFGEGKGSAGFRIGLRGPIDDYRHAIFFGKGLDVGFTADGGLFIGDVADAVPGALDLRAADSVRLTIVAEPKGGAFDLRLEAVAAGGVDTRNRAQVSKSGVTADQLRGSIALINNFGAETHRTPAKGAGKAAAATGPRAGLGRFRFGNLFGSNEGLERHPDRAFGPILFAQYTLSRGVLKLTAQMAPISPQSSQEVELIFGDRKLTAPIHPEARTATFRIDDWTADADTPYVLRYAGNVVKGADAPNAGDEFPGTIRREPTDKTTLTVADISCNIHTAFPNAEYVANVKKLDPDLIAFTGDQFYESTGGFGVTVEPLDMAVLDYLRKWYIHGWTWRDLTRDRPSISIPDDHDVYQGNIWGESGAPQTTTQEAGGYRMPAPWVNVVHRTQTSHHPDPYDPTPVKQGITQYYGRMVYAGVDFAILADRMYKSAPEGNVPPTGGRGDHVKDPNFDPRTADLPGLELLGAKQEEFLAKWADDWKDVVLKAVVSQTIFTAMATTHGGNREVLRADYDTNGWPQTARNRAVALLRKAKAFHLAGDQHLPALVRYGIENPRDAVYAFAGPAVNVGYPRWWEPTEPGKNRAPGAPEITGDFRDHFGNWLTVVAVANGAVAPRATILEQMADKASGLGIVRFDKQARKITIECWPYLVDPTVPGAKQFAGWPVTVDVPA